MNSVATGKPVPAFSLHATGDKAISLRDLTGRNFVLYFYPRDNTPGCTTEGIDFSTHFSAFQDLATDVFGVSRDSVGSHEGFKARQNFPFDLLSDEDGELCRLFDVIREKNMYGRKVMGIERSTFLIDANGVLRQEWRKVKVKGHVNEVLAAVKAL